MITNGHTCDRTCMTFFDIMYVSSEVIMVKIVVLEKDSDKEIKTFLETFYLSKAKIHQLFQNKCVYRNQKNLYQLDKIKKGDVIDIDFSCLDQQPIIPFMGPIEILYEDQDMMILNKPKSLLVHTDGNTIDTLTNRVAYHKKDYPYQILPVHRLDYETSGLLIFAKHPLAHAFLSHQFEERQVEKKYIALVEGVVSKDKDVIDLPIARDRHSEKQRVSKDGKRATSIYRVIKRFNSETLCEVMIIGGRKHQIRVHMASIGHPVVGDKLYGHLRKNHSMMCLEFTACKFIHPTQRVLFKYQLKTPNQV